MITRNKQNQSRVLKPYVTGMNANKIKMYEENCTNWTNFILKECRRVYIVNMSSKY